MGSWLRRGRHVMRTTGYGLEVANRHGARCGGFISAEVGWILVGLIRKLAIIQTLLNVRGVSQSQSRAHTQAAGRVRVQRHSAVQTADQVAAKRVADRQYQRDRRRSGAEEQSAEHFERVHGCSTCLGATPSYRSQS